MNKLLRPEYLLSVLSGVLFPLPFLSEHFSFIAWFSLVPLLYALKLKPCRAIGIGIIFGTISSCLGHYWLVGTLTRFGEFPIWLSSILILIYCLYLGVQYAVFGYLVSKVKLIQRTEIINLFIVCCLWTTIEHFFPSLFPYGLGNTQAYNLKIIQVAELVGVSLLSFIMVFVNLTIFLTIVSIRQREKKPMFALALSVLFVTFLFLYGSIRIEQVTADTSKAEKIHVGVIQGNFDFFEKILDNSGRIVEEHKQMSKLVGSADLIIWPEASVVRPIHTSSNYLEFSNPDEKIIPQIKGAYFLVGGIAYSTDNNSIPKTNYYNSAFLTDWDGKIIDRYDKNKPLLFGEYLPFSNFIPWSKYLGTLFVDFITAGTELNILNIKDKGIKIGTLICYEDLLPELSRNFSLKGANLLINLTNDAWFGRSPAPHQHLLVSIPRAVETRRSLVRATNTGVSAVVTPVGKVRNKTEIFKKEVFMDEVALLYSNTIYMKIGDIFPWGCLTFFVLFVFHRHLKRRYSGDGI